VPGLEARPGWLRVMPPDWGGGAVLMPPRQPSEDEGLALRHVDIIDVGNMTRKLFLLAFILPAFTHHVDD